MRVLLHGPTSDRYVNVSWWDSFTLWVERDAVQLGIGLTTYYLVCALVGAFNGMLYTWQIGRILAAIR